MMGSIFCFAVQDDKDPFESNWLFLQCFESWLEGSDYISIIWARFLGFYLVACTYSEIISPLYFIVQNKMLFPRFSNIYQLVWVLKLWWLFTVFMSWIPSCELMNFILLSSMTACLLNPHCTSEQCSVVIPGQFLIWHMVIGHPCKKMMGDKSVQDLWRALLLPFSLINIELFKQ